MFSNNLKRSVATLGVVAGLLAAAVPASAMPGSISGKKMTDAIAAKPVSSFSFGGSQSGTMHVAAPTDAGTPAGLNANGGDDTLYARGTQVGSEGRDGFLDIGTTETLDITAMPGRATTISAARPSTSFPS